MSNPAYDPTTGKPVYDPTTRKPAMNCRGGAGGCPCLGNPMNCGAHGGTVAIDAGCSADCNHYAGGVPWIGSGASGSGACLYSVGDVLVIVQVSGGAYSVTVKAIGSGPIPAGTTLFTGSGTGFACVGSGDNECPTMDSCVLTGEGPCAGCSGTWSVA